MKVLLPQATFLNGKLLVMTAAGNPNGVYDPAVDPNIHTPTQCADLQIKEYYRDLGNGTGFSELVLSFINTDYYFNGAEIYLQSHSPTGAEIIETPSVLDVYSTDVKSAGAWHYYDTAVNALSLTYTSQGDVYTFKVVSTNTAGLKADFNEAPTLTYTVRGKSIIPNIPTGMEVQFAKEVTWSWNHGDTDIDFWELRLEQNPGEQYGLLDKIGAPLSHKKPPNRSGAIYLYAHNAIGNYSTPLGYLYDKPKPPKPFFIGVDYIFQGFVVTTEDLPSDVIGINVYATLDGEDKVYYAPSNTLVIKTTSQYVGVRVAFVDIFGEGELSELKTYENVVKINAELLAAEAVSLEHMDGVIKEAVKKAQDSANADDVIEQMETLNTELTNALNWKYAQTQSDMVDLTTIVATNKAEITDRIDNVTADVDAQITAIHTDLTTVRSELNTAVNDTLGTLRTDLDTAVTDINATIATVQDTLTTSIELLEANTVPKVEFNEKHNLLVQADENAHSAIQQTNTDITSIVGKLRSAPDAVGQYESISAVKQQADSISSIVTSNKADADQKYTNAMSSIAQTAYDLTSVVVELDKDPFDIDAPSYHAFSYVKQKADSINATIVDVDAKLNMAPDAAGQYLAITQLNATTRGLQSMVATLQTVAADTQDSAEDIVLWLSQDPFSTPIETNKLALGGTSTTITLAADANTTGDYYRGMTIALISSTGAGQQRIISAYDNITKVATVSVSWDTIPNNTTRYNILNIPPYLAISSLKQSVDEVNILVASNTTNLQGQITQATSNITQNATSISSVVAQLQLDPFSANPPIYNAFTKIKQTTDSISTTIANTTTNLESQITQNAGSISTLVTELNKDPFSATPPTYAAFTQIKQKTDSISATVATKATITDLNLTKDSINLMVAEFNKDPYASNPPRYTAFSKIKATTDSISSTVAANKTTADGQYTTLSSNITQTNNSITAMVGQMDKDPFSIDPPVYKSFAKIKATTDSITAEVATKASLANLTLTNNSITAMVGELNKDPYSATPPSYQSISLIKQKADTISSTVTANKASADSNHTLAMSQISQRANEISIIAGELNKDPYATDAPTYVAFSRIKAKTDEISLTVAAMATTASLNIERDKINSVVTELNKPVAECSYTAIAQTLDNIQFRASNGTVQSLLNISPQVVSIKSDFLHITSTVQIDNNVIVGRMIQSGAISSDHIASGGLPFSSLAAAAQDYINLASANASSAVTSTKLWAHGTDATYINGGMIFTGSITANQISAGTLTVGTFAPTIQSIINTAGGWRSNLDATYINGGKLYTGSVTAAKIKTGEITVGHLDASAQSTLSTASTNASNALTNAAAAQTAANNAQGTANNAIGYINGWAQPATNYTYINGGKIYTGTIQADAIATGVITIGKLDAAVQGTINTASGWRSTANTTYIDGGKIYTGSITADQIATKAITADKVDATVMNLTSNGKTMNAGAVQLDATGMKVTEASGAYTKFDANGITWYSPAQRPFGTIRRTIYGTVNSGERVYFSEAFDKNPIIMITPTILKTYDPNVPQPTQLICRPTPLSLSDPYMKTGFLAQIETRVDGSRIYVGGNNMTDVSWWPPRSLNTAKSWQTNNIHEGIGSNENRGRVYGAKTTAANTTSIYANMTFVMESGYQHYFSAFFAQGYYKPSGSPSWIAGGRWNAPFPGGDYNITFDLPIATGLTPGTYDYYIYMEGYINWDRCRVGMAVNTITEVIGGIISSNAQASFLVMETDGNQYFYKG